MINNLLKPKSFSFSASIAIFILRLVSGVAFALHGWGKIQQPFSWMGPDSAIPGFFLFLAALAEFGGGIAWVAGLLTPIASFGIFCTMVVAVYFHMIISGDPFVNNTGGGSYEPALIYLAISLVILVLGPGKISLDSKIFGEK